MPRKLTKEERLMVLAAAMQVDLTPYQPLKTFMVANDRSPTIEELAGYIKDIRILEVTSILNHLETMEVDDAPEAA